VCAQLENDVHRPHQYRDRATRSRVLVRRSPSGLPNEGPGLPREGARVRLAEGLESRSVCSARRFACCVRATSELHAPMHGHGRNAATMMPGTVPLLLLHRLIRCSGLFRLDGPWVGEPPARLEWLAGSYRSYQESW
jgi:hypothetical protein